MVTIATQAWSTDQSVASGTTRLDRRQNGTLLLLLLLSLLLLLLLHLLLLLLLLHRCLAKSWSSTQGRKIGTQQSSPGGGLLGVSIIYRLEGRMYRMYRMLRSLSQPNISHMSGFEIQVVTVEGATRNIWHSPRRYLLMLLSI